MKSIHDSTDQALCFLCSPISNQAVTTIVKTRGTVFGIQLRWSGELRIYSCTHAHSHSSINLSIDYCFECLNGLTWMEIGKQQRSCEVPVDLLSPADMDSMTGSLVNIRVPTQACFHLILWLSVAIDVLAYTHAIAYDDCRHKHFHMVAQSSYQSSICCIYNNRIEEQVSYAAKRLNM